MAEKKKKLGKGLDAIFGGDITSLIDDIEHNTPESSQEKILLSDIRPNPYQPRKVFDEDALNELSESIKNYGVFQPIIVKKSIKGYDIIAGERRVKASKIAGKTTIPAIIRDFSDEQMMQIALLENLQRENLSAIEEATAYRDIINALSLTQDELAKKLGKSRSHITNMLGLLKLPSDVQDMVLKNDLSMGHARVLSKLENETEIKELANKVKDDGLSVRELENQVNSTYKRSVPIKRREKSDNKEYKYLEDALEEKLGTKVKILSGKIQINYSSVSDLNRIMEILNINIEE